MHAACLRHLQWVVQGLHTLAYVCWLQGCTDELSWLQELIEVMHLQVLSAQSSTMTA